MNDKIIESKTRELFYALYSRIFMLEADAALIETLKQKDVKEFFPNLDEWELFHTLSVTDLINHHFNPDFTEISLLHLTPYESFFVRQDAMIESGGDNPIYEFYERFDYQVEKDKARVVSPDHIGVELEFLYMLVKAQTKALENQDETGANELKSTQIEFMEKHLLKFAPMYLINVKTESQTPLYHDAAMTGLEFILSDYQQLKTS